MEGIRLILWLEFTTLIEKRFPPPQVIFHDLLELLTGIKVDYALVESVGRTKTLGIPRPYFTKHHARFGFTKHLDHEAQMAAHHLKTLIKGWFSRKLTCSQEGSRMFENPWVVKSTSAHRYAVTACVL